MCGIAGILKIHDPKDGEPPHPLEAIPEKWLDILDESIKHRGPDGQGRFRDRAVREDGIVVDVALVHRRLSIIDHEGGHQPMVHDGTRLREDLTYQPGEEPKLAHELAPGLPLVAVVFNGCIYNHRELRKELEAKGHVFETDHSDTEVLVHGWRAFQHKFFSQLDSMHAVASWARKGAEFSLSRDFAGEKPLYRSIDPFGSVVLFSSTTGGLVKLINSEARYPVGMSKGDFFGNDTEIWIQDGKGPTVPLDHMEIQSPCSTDAIVPQHQDAYVQLYDVPWENFEFPERDQPSTAEHIHDLIVHATASRLEADVPLGIFLSGGIDSGLIAAIAKKHRPDIKTFTVRMPDARIDESEAGGETARHLGTDHHTLECDPHPADDLVLLIHQLGLPFGDSSLLPTYWVSKAARQHVKVALAGDGADELFGGYRRHVIADVLANWRGLLSKMPKRLPKQQRQGSRSDYLTRLFAAAASRGYPDLLAIFPSPDFNQLLGRSGKRKLDTDRNRMIEGAVSRFPSSFANDALQHDFTQYLPDDILRKTDTASMAIGLEVRAPFLARELVEAALRTPLDVLMPNGQRKGLLKQVARKYLPDHIVDRPKQGFAIPIGEWFRSDYGKMRTLLYDHLESSDPFPGLADAGVAINMGFVRQMCREHDAAGEKSINPWHGRDHSQRLYMLLVLSIWAKWLNGLRGSSLSEPGRQAT